ncbi:ChaB family protein [Microbulbifer yueqingensis]|uniref:Cation transport regulator n=1 Tax=Microbulbifer yueqingensis TaxID=658219 RepID=A0A1G8VD09_9GAMM|nr:ChaB family protein [Microbulbifer yueqingensis]SDJ63747.1 cation transport regulator [Microbulbifer yueqingensis]
MPYANPTELPDNVRNVLPMDAQEVYLEAFNSAWDKYEDPNDRRGATREEAAHAGAWAAVKAKYEEDDDGDWHPKH